MKLRGALIAGIVLIAWGFGAQPQDRATQQPKQPTSSPQHPTPTAPRPGGTVVYQKKCQRPENHQHEATNSVGYWHATIENPESWLVGVGIVTLFFLGWQAKATAEAAKATLRAVRLQSEQWVDVDNWRISSESEPPDGTVPLRLAFDIFNPTQFPLTLVRYRWTPSLKVTGRTFPAEVPLPAQRIAPKGKRSFYHIIRLEGVERTAYLRDSLSIQIVLEVTFRNIGDAGKNTECAFSYKCTIGKDLTNQVIDLFNSSAREIDA